MRKVTGLRFNANTITKDMTDYHAFGEINKRPPPPLLKPDSWLPTARILMDHTDKVAEGIREGVLCFVRNEPVSITPTPKP